MKLAFRSMFGPLVFLLLLALLAGWRLFVGSFAASHEEKEKRGGQRKRKRKANPNTIEGTSTHNTHVMWYTLEWLLPL